MDLTKTTLGFLGAGNMGQSMIHGLLQSQLPPKHILVCDHHPEQLKDLQGHGSIKIVNSSLELAQGSDVLILAVKPQSLISAVTPMIGFQKAHQPLLISILAGVTVDQIRATLHLASDYPVLRAMPNTPALIQAGISGLYADSSFPSKARGLCEVIMKSIGDCVWIEDESHMNIVTALSGSGPAYFFYFVEQLINSATQLGLPRETAERLSLTTGLGALLMATHQKQPLRELRQKVTSKGGTTEAALNSMMHDHLDEIMFRAIKTATQRGQELSEAFSKK